MATKQRTKAPTLLCGGMTHSGEMSHGLLKAIEWIVTKAYALTARAKKEDGVTPKDASKETRRGLKNSLASAMFRGWGATLRLGGGTNPYDRFSEDHYDF